MAGHFSMARVAIILTLAAASSPAVALELAPYQDERFGYPGVLQTRDNGDFVKVDYNEARDIDQRDAVPEQKVHGEYVSLKPSRSQKKLSFKSGQRRVKYITVGKSSGARVIVIYIPGQGGNRRQGMDDWRFGGNFNRLKNLMVRNGGLYVTTDFKDFGERGKNDVKTLMSLLVRQSPGAPVIVACGSMGGAICWHLSEDAEAAAMLGGLMFLGSMWNNDFLKSSMLRDRSKWVPIYFGHGSSDRVFGWETLALFYRTIRKKAPGYPVKFTLFQTGTHGTPIRMTDWRLTLNWMLKVNRR